MKRKNHPTRERCIRRGMVRFLREKRAVTVSEYAFMLAMIMLVSVAAITAFSDSAIIIMKEVTTSLTDAADEHL